MFVRRRLLPALFLAAALGITACGDSKGASTSSSTSISGDSTATASTGPGTSATSVAGPTFSTDAVPAPALEWVECGDDLDCTTLTAPLDWSDPNAPGQQSVRLKVVRHRALKAKKRIGSMLVNPGGPGFGGSYLAENATSFFSKTILERFDIVAWDPRGTGASQPAVDCIDDYDRYFGEDVTGGPEAEQQDAIKVSKEFAAACSSKNGDLLAHISTQDTARDMDLLRRALGEEKISYFGFSYGSELGGVWLTMFPHTVRSAVLDGAADPTADAMQATLDQAAGFEGAFNAFLAQCATKCSFPRGEDPGAAFDRIIADIDANDYPTDPGRPTLNLMIAYTAVAQALYSTDLWPSLDAALDSARDGAGTGLLRLYDDYFQRKADGTYTNDIEAFMAITCADDGGPTTVEGVDAYAAEILRIAPRLGPSFLHGYSCVFWPVRSAPKITVTGKGAGPVLVIGTSNDPATPYEGTVKMARTLEGGVLIRVEANGHLGYLQSKCAQKVVDQYLADNKVPSADVEC